ncbi:MAG: hypothetical protein RLZZ293_791 [Pseudomonadota bacterium]
MAIVRPYQLALYSNWRVNSLQIASDITLDSLRLPSIPAMFKSSRLITWFSLISLLDNLCKKSLRLSDILLCSRATLSRASFALLLPLSFLLNRFCNLANFFWYLINAFKGFTFSPSEVS